jgi:protein SCO1
MNDRRKALALFGLGALGAAAATALKAAPAMAAPMIPPASTARRDRLRRHFPNVSLRTHDGRTVRFYDDLVKDKKVIINFTYTNCSNSCPTSSANLAKVQRLLGDRVGREIFLLSLSLDPDRDTPEALKEYADKWKAGPGWTFATGSRQDIDAIRRQLGLYDSPDFTDHMGLLTFGNEPEGKWAATPALDRPEKIVYAVLRRVDPFKYSDWPRTTQASATAGETNR